MLFDFRKQFGTWSDAQLLDVVLHPGKYQVEAVTIAQELLDARGVVIAEVIAAREKLVRSESFTLSSADVVTDDITELTEALQPTGLGFWAKSKLDFMHLFLSRTHNPSLIAFRVALVICVITLLYHLYHYVFYLQYVLGGFSAGYYDVRELMGSVLTLGFILVVIFSILTVRKFVWYLLLFTALFTLLALVVRVVSTGELSETGFDELYTLGLYGVLLYGLLSATPLAIFRILPQQKKMGLLICGIIAVLLLFIGYNDYLISSLVL